MQGKARREVSRQSLQLGVAPLSEQGPHMVDLDTCRALPCLGAIQPAGERFHRRPLQAASPALRQHLPRGVHLPDMDERFDVTQPVLRLRRIGPQRGLQVRQANRRLLALHGQQSKLVIRFRVVRLTLQDDSVQALGLLQAARPVLSQGLLQDVFDRKGWRDHAAVLQGVGFWMRRNCPS